MTLKIQLIEQSTPNFAQPIQAVIIPTEKSLIHPTNKLGKKLFRDAGEGLENHLLDKSCQEGESLLTKSYELKKTYGTNFIIHSVITLNDSTQTSDAIKSLSQFYQNSLQVAAKKKILSIALPIIDFSSANLTLESSVKLAIKEINSFIRLHPDTEILLTCETEQVYQLAIEQQNKKENDSMSVSENSTPQQKYLASDEFAVEMDKLEKLLMCQISKKLLQNPQISIGCQHVFSSSAISGYLASGKTTCPVNKCGKKLTLVPMLALNDALKVITKNKEENAYQEFADCFKNLEEKTISELVHTLKCTMTQYVLLDSVLLANCGHSSERDHTEGLFVSNTSAEQKCPCCRSNFKKEDMISQPIIAALVYNLSRISASFIEEVYYSNKTLGNLLVSIDSYKINCILFQYQKTPNLLNEIDKNNNTGLITLSSFSEGRKLLIANVNLRNSISAEAWNARLKSTSTLTEGVSPLYYLMNSPEGVQLLNMDDSLCDKIGMETFISVVPNQDMAACHALALTSEGIQLYLKHPRLQDCITAEVLNKTCNKPENKNISLLYLFCRNSYGLDLLAQNERLRNAISSEVLCIEHTTGDFSASALLWLVGFINGLNLLRNDVNLCNKITKEGFSRVHAKGLFQGLSALTSILRYKNKEGLFLLQNPRLQSYITSESLEAIPQHEGFRGMSAFFYISLMAETRGLLDNAEFRAKITSAALNTAVTFEAYKGVNPLFFLLTEGFTLITRYSDLRSKITAEGLETVSESELQNLGMSPLLALMANDEGLKLLNEDKELRDKISVKALNQRKSIGKAMIDATPFYAATTRVAGIQFLANYPEVCSKVLPETLIEICVSFQNSPLMVLIWSDVGIDLLLNSYVLRSKINLAALTNVAKEGELKGQLPLIKLESFPKGRALLALLFEENPKMFVSFKKFMTANGLARLQSLGISFEKTETAHLTRSTVKQNRALKIMQILEKYQLPNATIENLHKALRRAAADDDSHDVMILLQKHCDVNEPDNNPNNKKTALHWAVINSSLKVIPVLMAAEAKQNIPDASGQTAEDYAKKKKNPKVLQFLGLRVSEEPQVSAARNTIS